MWSSLLTGGQRGRDFLGYGEFGALRHAGNQSGRVAALRYRHTLIVASALLARRSLRGLGRRRLRRASIDPFADPSRCDQCGKQTDSNRSADAHRCKPVRSGSAPFAAGRRRAATSGKNVDQQAIPPEHDGRNGFVLHLQRAQTRAVPWRPPGATFARPSLHVATIAGAP